MNEPFDNLIHHMNDFSRPVTTKRTVGSGQVGYGRRGGIPRLKKERAMTAHNKNKNVA